MKGFICLVSMWIGFLVVTSLECNTRQMGVFQFVMNAPQGAAIEDFKRKIIILIWKLLLDSRNPSPNWKAIRLSTQVLNPVGMDMMNVGYHPAQYSMLALANALLLYLLCLIWVYISQWHFSWFVVDEEWKFKKEQMALHP